MAEFSNRHGQQRRNVLARTPYHLHISLRQPSDFTHCAYRFPKGLQDLTLAGTRILWNFFSKYIFFEKQFLSQLRYYESFIHEIDQILPMRYLIEEEILLKSWGKDDFMQCVEQGRF
ncbi:hypothetical protein AAFN90_16330 [Erwiniaceae bacterium CAU 1747]